MKNKSNVEFRFLGNDTIKDSKLNCTYKEYFYKKYGNKEWAQNVVFLGQVEDCIKEKEFANCDIFIAPSLYESFGIILIEAMSAKKPVIGCRIGGMQEIVDDNYNGYLIDVENSNQLEEKISILVNNPEKRKSFGLNGYKRYEENFSNEIMINNTLNTYKEFVKR